MKTISMIKAKSLMAQYAKNKILMGGKITSKMISSNNLSKSKKIN
jgi:hypothetical protein